MMTVWKKIAAAAAVLTWQAAAVAQSPPPPSPTLLTLTVDGRATRAPDVVEMSGGVVTSAPTAAAAMIENATRMTAVVAAIRKAGIAERDIQTAGLSLQAQYRYEANQAPILTAYQAVNTVNLRVRAIPMTGKLLDTLVGAGANQINGPTFRVENSDAAIDEARLSAMTTARARAALYAQAAGLQVRRIASITESIVGDPGPRPMMMKTMSMDSAAATTPVAPGEVDLSVNVTMVFELD